MEQVGNYGYSTGGYTIEGLQRLKNTDGDIRCSHMAQEAKTRRNEKDIDQLKEAYEASGLTVAEYSRMYNVPYNTLWYHVKGSKPDRHPFQSVWTPENLKYFKDNYAETPNIELAAKFGVKVATIQKRANMLGLHKSHEVRLKNAEIARSLSKTDEAKRKQGETRKKVYEADKRRIVFGMEQKTKLRVGLNVKRSTLKANMKFKNGYISLSRMSNTLYYTETTKRSAIREAKAAEYGLIVLELK